MQRGPSALSQALVAWFSSRPLFLLDLPLQSTVGELGDKSGDRSVCSREEMPAPRQRGSLSNSVALSAPVVRERRRTLPGGQVTPAPGPLEEQTLAVTTLGQLSCPFHSRRPGPAPTENERGRGQRKYRIHTKHSRSSTTLSPGTPATRKGPLPL